jgi:zinc-ribbon domain
MARKANQRSGAAASVVGTYEPKTYAITLEHDSEGVARKEEQQRQLTSPLITPTSEYPPQDKLAKVRETIALSPKEALDEAQSFLTGLGYNDMRRVDNSLRAQRHPPANGDGQRTFFLTVAADPQPGGGVRISISGDDGEGVLENQAEWTTWSESLPKQPQAQTKNMGEQRTEETRTEETTDVSHQPPAMMAGTHKYCPNCRHRTQPGENFCPECGHPLRLQLP